MRGARPETSRKTPNNRVHRVHRVPLQEEGSGDVAAEDERWRVRFLRLQSLLINKHEKTAKAAAALQKHHFEEITKRQQQQAKDLMLQIDKKLTELQIAEKKSA